MCSQQLAITKLFGLSNSLANRRTKRFPRTTDFKPITRNQLINFVLLYFSFQPGDRVYTNGSLTGTYAEYTLCNEDSVFLLADQLDFKGGAALGIPYFTAYRALVQRYV